MQTTVGGITVGELAHLPYLRTKIVAGHAGLDRRVSWAHVSESRTPWDWHEPGDLVLTSGGIIPATPDEQVEFVERLASADLSGLVVGVEEPACPALTQPMLDIADRLGFPLLVVDYPISFAAHVRTVAAANEQGDNHSLRHIMRVHDEVRTSLIAQRSSVDFLDRLGRVLDCRCSVVDVEWWEPALPGCTVPDPAWRASFDEGLRVRGGMAPLVMRLEVGDELALAMSIPVERSAVLVVQMEREPAPRLAVLQHVAAACALEITRVDAAFERQRRAGGALLSEALGGRIDAKLLELGMSERGLDAPCHCVAIEAGSAVIDRLARQWAVRGVPNLLGGAGPIHTAVVQSDPAVLDGLGERAEIEGCRVGVSDPFSGAGGLNDAMRQARWALETIRPDVAGLTRYGEGGDAFLPRTVAEAKVAANRVLGPVLRYDREHGTDLVKTLQTYLSCDRSPKQAAETLFVHTQTVNYRINCVQDLTGRSTRSTGDISELWFALRALALSEMSPV